MSNNCIGRIWSNELNKLSQQIVEWRKSKQFYTPSSMSSRQERDALLGKLMLVVTEVSEAAEAVRHNDQGNFKEELADAIIRLLDISGSLSIDIEQYIADKMEINRTRELCHGKTTTL